MAFPSGGRNPFRHDCPLACELATYSMRHLVARVGLPKRPGACGNAYDDGARQQLTCHSAAASKASAPLRMHNHPLPRWPRLKISPDEHDRKHHKYSYHRRTHQHRIQRHDVLLLKTISSMGEGARTNGAAGDLGARWMPQEEASWPASPFRRRRRGACRTMQRAAICDSQAKYRVCRPFSRHRPCDQVEPRRPPRGRRLRRHAGDCRTSGEI